MDSSAIKRLAFEGLKWSYLQQFIVLAINYGTLLILANLIEPKYHGAVVLASIPTGLTGVLGTMGVREKILKEASISAEKFKALMGLVIAISVVLTLLTLNCICNCFCYFMQNNFRFGYYLILVLHYA